MIVGDKYYRFTDVEDMEGCYPHLDELTVDKVTPCGVGLVIIQVVLYLVNHISF